MCDERLQFTGFTILTSTNHSKANVMSHSLRSFSVRECMWNTLAWSSSWLDS